jgi:hypothetical protein
MEIVKDEIAFVGRRRRRSLLRPPRRSDQKQASN